ncbi:hypothetical protein chiPu_0019509, partial [Chiloscyllium punctatum]|nr:hypothetical protein [Chiloscyllium punctatum]
SLSLLNSLPDSSIEILSDYSTTEEFLYGQVIPNNMDQLIFVIKGRFVVLRLVDLTQCPCYHRFIVQELPFLKSTIQKPESSVDRRFLNLTLRSGSTHRGLDRKSWLRMPSTSTSLIRQHGASRTAKGLSASSSTVSITSTSEISSKTQQWKTKSQSQKFLKVNSAISTTIVRIDMQTFAALMDQQTLQKVRRLQSVYPSDDELCDLFIKNNYWKIFKRSMISKLTCKPQRFSPSGQVAESGRGEDLYEIDKTGILNLPEISSNRNMLFSKPSYYVAPVIRTREDGSTPMPKLDLQLIHGIAKLPSSIANLLY